MRIACPSSCVRASVELATFAHVSCLRGVFAPLLCRSGPSLGVQGKSLFLVHWLGSSRDRELVAAVMALHVIGEYVRPGFLADRALGASVWLRVIGVMFCRRQQLTKLIYIFGWHKFLNTLSMNSERFTSTCSAGSIAAFLSPLRRELFCVWRHSKASRSGERSMSA